MSVFGALHCMSCSSCLLSAKILHMQIYMRHLGSSCMFVQQVRLPHSLPANRSREVSISFVQNEHIFPKGWPHSAVCLGTQAECRAGERLAEWHVLRGCHSGGTAQKPDKHGGRVGPSDFLVGRMELCPSDEFSDRDFDLRDSGIRHCY